MGGCDEEVAVAADLGTAAAPGLCGPGPGRQLLPGESLRRQCVVGGRVDDDLGTSPDHTRGHRPEGGHHPGGDEPRRRHEPVRGPSVSARGDQEGVVDADPTVDESTSGSFWGAPYLYNAWLTDYPEFMVYPYNPNVGAEATARDWLVPMPMLASGRYTILYAEKLTRTLVEFRSTWRRRRVPARRDHGIGSTTRRRL